MFDSKVFYHGTTRKAIIAFGAMFNKLQIYRKDTAGNVVQHLRVPLAYAPKNKMLSRIQQLPNADTLQAEVTLPRLSFEIIAFEYDGARKTNSMNQTATTIGQTTAKRVYGPVPYNLTVNLYAYAKNQEDGLQIFEQIVPAFNPDFNVTVNYIPDLNIKHDLPIILNSVSFQDDYEGSLEQQRMIIWTYTFTMKLYYYGPVETQGIIRNSIVSVFNNTNLDQLTAKYTASTDPTSATPADNFDFTFNVDETNY
jgi:hypothetical protein